MSAECHSEPSHDGSALLDIGGGVGALLVHAGAALAGQEVEVSLGDGATARTHTLVRERNVGGRRFFAALFPSLSAGEYTLWSRDRRVADHVTVTGGELTEMTVTVSPDGSTVTRTEVVETHR
jgi:hypothetical protein